MQQGYYEILENRILSKDTYWMRLAGDTGGICRPGQFVNIRIDGFYLRRPISICDWDDNSLTLIYKVVGRGTEKMAQMAAGEKLDLLCALGNGFDIGAIQGGKIMLIGGGVGVPPLVGLARRLMPLHLHVAAALGFADADMAFGADLLLQYGVHSQIATVDGSLGTHGFVTDILKAADYDYYFACGPQPMLKAVHALGHNGQLSFEERMGCGFGACMGCSCKTLVGNKRVCVDGPVFLSTEVSFDEQA